MSGIYLKGNDGVYRRHGRQAILVDATNDGFEVGMRPTTGTVGLIPGAPLTLWTGSDIIEGNDAGQPHRLIESKLFPMPIKTRGKVRFLNCKGTNLDNVQPTSETALINTQHPDVIDTIIERCELDPGEDGAHWYLNAVSGHHTWIHRSRARRVVDFFGSFNPYAPETANVVTSSVLEWLAYWYSPTAGVVHPSDVRTHNDGIQHQGGGGDAAAGRPYGLDVDGVEFWGLNFWADGVTPPTDQSFTEQYLAHQGVLTQQNVSKSTPINPRVRRSWFHGFQHALVFKTAADASGNPTGTNYNAIVENNTLDDDRRYYGTSNDFYGVPGGVPFNIRLDRGTTVNGVQYEFPLPVYPGAGATKQTSAEQQVGGNNRYFSGTETVGVARRGQPITVRRDNFYGG